MKIDPKEIAIRNFYSSKTNEELSKIEKRETLITGIKKIDELFGFPTGYYVICGNPGTGKGFFSTWMIKESFIRNEVRSVFFSLEMGETLVRGRLLQQWSNLTEQEFKDGNDTTKAIELMREDMIIVDTFFEGDTRLQTPANFRKLVEEYYEMGYRAFHFDHLHELEGSTDNAKNQGVTEKWAKEFQQVCKDYSDIWLFVFAQPNGQAANKNILRRTDIQGSKSITQKCEFFLSLNKQIKLDDKGNPFIDTESRDIILYLDKTRVTSRTNIGFKLYFHETGNFYEQQDIQPNETNSFENYK